MPEPTLHSRHSSADLCRLNGWSPGTVLEGDEGYGPERIVLTAVGEQHILARAVAGGMEGHFTLECRDWREVEALTAEPLTTKGQGDG